MDGFIGETRIVRPNFYHRPVSAPGEQKLFEELVEETIAEVGKEELIRRISEWASSMAAALRSGEERIAFTKVVYDITPSNMARSQLAEEVDQKNLLLKIGSMKMYVKTPKARERERMKLAGERWGARRVACSSPVWVQTGFEYSPYEGSRYPERWEPRGIDVHVTSEGCLDWRDIYRNRGTLNLQDTKDEILVSLSRQL